MTTLRGLFAAAVADAKGPQVTRRTWPDGDSVSLLGYGSMRMPTRDGGHANSWEKANYSKAGIDQSLLNHQIAYLLEQGVNYFDTSPAYCRGESERRLGEALAKSGAPRKDYYLATKLSNFAPAQFSAAASKDLFEKSLKNLRTDYIDYYLLHSVGNGGFETFEKRFVANGMIDWLFEQKKAGRIRRLGWSYHGDPKTVEWLLKAHDEGRYPWDFALIQMNYIDWRHAKQVNDRNLDAEYLYNELTKRGIRVAVMEPLLGGRLARYHHALARVLTPLDPSASQASWAFRFCASHPNVMTVLSGMTFTEHIEENCRTFSPLKPLTSDEFAALERAAEGYLSCDVVPCTGCNYCMPCPYGLDIPTLLAFRNEFLSKDKGLAPDALVAAYEKAIPEHLRRAEHCTGCGRCAPHCPQGIDIPDEIAAIDRAVEELRNATAFK